MKTTIKLEEVGIFILALYALLRIDPSLILLILTLFLPDLSMVGYVVNSKVGAFTYNLFHHRGLATLVIVVGSLMNLSYLIYAGAIVFAHSTLDRIFGYGLKHKDSFNSTHLGKIGKN